MPFNPIVIGFIIEIAVASFDATVSLVAKLATKSFPKEKDKMMYNALMIKIRYIIIRLNFLMSKKRPNFKKETTGRSVNKKK